MSSKQIILIDDEEDIVSTLEFILRKKGFDIISFSRPKEAQDYILMHSKNISLIITDFSMPLINGDDLAKELKAKGINIPIILATADSQINNEQELFHSLIEKPYSTDTLIEVLKKAA